MVIKVKVNGEWIKVPCAVEEAPKDGQQYVRKDGDWSAVEIPEVDLSGIESSIETIETSINELDTNKASKTEVTEQINAAVASVYKVKGSVANYAALPTENVSIGDVYNLEDTGANYVATSTTPDWDKLSETVDLSGYLTKTEATSTYQPKGNYLTSVPEEYVTETELTAKGYATTTQVNTKLDSSAYTATDVLSKVKTVDGSDSGLDADLLDGKHGSEYALKTDIVEEAPKDGKQYVRQDGNWSKAEVSGGLENEEVALLLIDLIDRDELTLTQDEADKISSICPEVGSFGHAMSNIDALGNGSGEIPEKYILWVVQRPDKNSIRAYFNLKCSYVLGSMAFVLMIDLPSLTYTVDTGLSGITGDSDGDINTLTIASQFHTPDGSSYFANANLITGGDGTKFLSNSGEYKTVGPLLNEEYGKIVMDAITNETITQDNFDKLKNAVTDTSVADSGSLFCEGYVEGIGTSQFFIIKIEQGFAVYVRIQMAGTSNVVSNMVSVVSINNDLTVEVIGGETLNLTSSGDGTRFLANNGQYVEIDTSNFATKNELEGKQNTISDLDTIRSNAEKGKQALESLPTNLSQLTSDETHRTVTDSEKSTWNSKSDFSGSFSDLTNIPAKITNLRSYTTASTVASLNVNYESIYVTLTSNASLSASATGADYNGRTITAYVYTSAARTITIPTTGNYVSMCGSSFTTTASGWVEFNLTCIDGKWHIAKLEQ